MELPHYTQTEETVHSFLRSSPFSHLIDTTSGVPPPLVAASIRARIRTNNDEIACLMDRIHLLRADNAFHEQILSPIRHCPPDILNHIFMFVVLDTFRTMPMCLFGNDTETYGRAPWNLASVCKLWRHFVVTNPLLWSFINITIPHQILDERTNTKIHTSYLHTQMARTADVALLIKLNASRGGPGMNSQVIPILAQHLPRCRYLEVAPKLSSYFKDLHFPNVTHFITNNVTLPEEDNLEFLTNAERLTHVEGLRFHPRQMSELPWNQLTRLDLTVNTSLTSDLLSVMRQSQNIIALRLLFFLPRSISTVTTGNEMLDIPNLRTLTLMGDRDTCHSFISIINTPKLNTLRVVVENKALPLSDLIRRSSCKLTNLYLHFPINGHLNPLSILAHYLVGRNLCRLVIVGRVDLQALFNVLSSSQNPEHSSGSSPQPMFPLIQSLILRKTSDLDPMLLLDTLEKYCLSSQTGLNSGLSLIELDGVKSAYSQGSLEGHEWWAAYPELEERARALAIAGVKIVLTPMIFNVGMKTGFDLY